MFRKIKKILATEIREVRVYNSNTKREEVIEVKVTEVDKEMTLPAGCVEISSSVKETKMFEYTLTPQEFVKCANSREVKAD